MRPIILSKSKEPQLFVEPDEAAYDPRQVVPIKYQPARELFLKGRANAWVPQEIPMHEDKTTWESDKLTPEQKWMFTLGISYLTASDNLVPDHLSKIMEFVGAVEVRQYLRWQISEEANHVESYLYILESFGLDSDSQGQIFKLYQTTPEISKKLNWNIHLTNNLNYGNFKTQLLLSLVGYHIFEFLFFPAGFAQVFALARRGLLRNTAEQYSYIWRDETLHAANSHWLIKQLLVENPGLMQPVVKTLIQDMIEESVALEIAHAEIALPADGLPGMSRLDYFNYVKYLANTISRRFGVTEIYPKQAHPMPWLDSYTRLQKVNFFEGRVREYQTNTKLGF